ncbi:MAG: AAA family ATPase [Sedimentisphaerales bacterium]|nr:AAA family ATPase [Sedimentisphaerales bacterium]
METHNVRTKIENRIQHMVDSAVIRNRRFLDDEQLIRSEQLAVLEEIFNANVRDAEINELSSHFAGVLRNDHPCHLAIWGKTGTGKTLTLTYFLNLLAGMCKDRNIPFRYEHLDLSTPRPCFRALNDLACLLNASRRYQKGISLEELMIRIESRLADYEGYFVLFIDEVDNIRRDADTFMTFVVRRLPQRIKAKLILAFVSNKLDWPDHLDARVKSFLKLNELIFKPYDAIDLQHILGIRVEKALYPDVIAAGVIEKIAAMASREHGDARKAVALLAKSAYLSEKAGTKIMISTVDDAASEIDIDRYVTLLQCSPIQLQATMVAIIDLIREKDNRPVSTGAAYEHYRAFCSIVGIRPLSIRAFGDMIAELDIYSFIQSKIISKGRYGRSREILLELPPDVIGKMHQAVLANFDLGNAKTPHAALTEPRACL